MTAWGCSLSGVRRVSSIQMLMAVAAVGGVLSSTAAEAQTATRTLAAQPSASLSDRRAFNIPAQPLSSALTAYGQQSGLQVTFDAGITSGRAARGVSGSFTSEETLRRLLAGTGITYRTLGAHTVALEREVTSAQDGVVTLPPVQIQGQNAAESPFGPGSGYVAHQSTAGTKTDTPIIETPQSISVVTKNQITDQGAQSIDQALRYSSGVVGEMQGNQTLYDTGFIRGFGAGGGIELPEFLDGLRLQNGTFIYPQVDPYALERIEVLKGPASVLYGQNDPGGIVNLVSKLPTAEPFHEVELQTGTYGRVEGRFDLSGPIDQGGQWQYRLTGLGLSTDTQTNYTKQQRLFIAPSLTWKPDADTSFTLLTNYQNEPAIGYLGTIPAQGTVLPNPNGKIPTNLFAGERDLNDNNRSQASVGYLFEHRFDDVWTVRQNFRYLHSDLDEAYVFNTGFLPGLTTLNQSSFVAHDRLDTVDLDNQAQAKFSTGPFTHTLLTGVDYQNNSNADQIGFGSAPTLNAFAPVYTSRPIAIPPISSSTEQQKYQVGVYSQDQIKLGKWSLLLGGREDWAGSTTKNAIANTSTSQFDRAFTGRVGVVYLFDSGVAPYVSYSTSFLPTAGTTFTGTPFTPTTAQQYEVGIKYQPPGSNSFLTVSGFNLTEQNVLTTDPNPAHIGFSVQTGEIRSRGVELEGKANLTNNLDLVASLTYADVVNTKSTTTDTTINGNVESTKGKHPIQVPATTAALWAMYTIPKTYFHGVALGGGLRYIGTSYGDDVNSFKVPDVALFDAAIHYNLREIDSRLSGYQVAVTASNIFDKQYVASCSGSTSCYFGLRRAVYASLKYQW